MPMAAPIRSTMRNAIGARATLRIELPAEPRVVPALRHSIAGFLRVLPLTAEEVEGLKLATCEAISNAIRHGSPQGPHSRVQVVCRVDRQGLVIEVVDQGPGVDSPRRGDRLPPPWETSGRGLFLMRQFTDGVQFVRHEQGLRVRLIKRLAGKAMPPPGGAARSPAYHASA